MWCGNWLAGKLISVLYGKMGSVHVFLHVVEKGEKKIDLQICSFLWKGWRQDRVPGVRGIGLV